MIAARRSALVVAAIAGLSACANTIDPEIAAELQESESVAVETVPFEPEGTSAELLAGLLDEATTLSEAIVENEGDNEILARVDAYWAAAELEVAESNATLARDIDRTVALMHNGVERRRPADADRATINLRTLVAAFDG